MDLLAGYDSDNSSAGSVPPTATPVSGGGGGGTGASVVAAAAPPATSGVPAPKKTISIPPKVNPLTGTQEEDTKKSKESKATNQRGKKLLKLQSVLPQHIWNQLTANVASSSNRYRDQDDDDDDDDDEDVEKHHHLGKRKDRKIPNVKPTVSVSSSSVGQSLLDKLNALPKSKKGNSTSTSTSGILGSTKAETMDRLDQQLSSSHAKKDIDDSIPSGLGSAFLTSTVQVTRTKKGQVRSIHSPNDDADNDKDDDDYKQTPSRDGVDQKSNHKDHTNTLSKEKVASSSQTKPLQQSSSPSFIRTNPLVSFSLAPSVHRRLAAAPPVRVKDPPSMAMYPTPPDFDEDDDHDGFMRPPPPHQQRQQLPPPPTTTTTAPPTLSSKARKRQMEAMLRAGNWDNVDSDIHLEGGGNSNYAMEAIRQQQQQVAPQYQAHGVRVVPTSHYNTSTGQMDASSSISGKQKGKNQLNALLANAASLEASRIENPQLSSNTTNRGTYRNNAKRKYGW